MINNKSKFFFAGIVICFLVLSTLAAPAQNKLPVIQAIGKITLKNGQTEEGVIALGYSYDNRHLHPNAFYHETPLEKQLILIDLDFTGFYAALLDESGKLFYAESKSDQSQSRYKISEDTDDKMLNKKTLREENFILKEEFSLYPRLPLSLNVSAKIKEDADVKKYRIDNISSFELMKEPPARWLEKIAQARTRLGKKMETDKKRSNLWLNYQEPLWYHDLIKDSKELTKWRHYFN